MQWLYNAIREETLSNSACASLSFRKRKNGSPKGNQGEPPSSIQTLRVNPSPGRLINRTSNADSITQHHHHHHQHHHHHYSHHHNHPHQRHHHHPHHHRHHQTHHHSYRDPQYHHYHHFNVFIIIIIIVITAVWNSDILKKGWSKCQIRCRHFCCLQSTKAFPREKGEKFSSAEIYFIVDTIYLLH